MYNAKVYFFHVTSLLLGVAAVVATIASLGVVYGPPCVVCNVISKSMGDNSYHHTSTSGSQITVIDLGKDLAAIKIAGTNK